MGEKDNDKSEEAEKTGDRVKSGAGQKEGEDMKEGEVLTSVADGDKTKEDGTASKDLVAQDDVKVVKGAGGEATKTESGEVNSKDVEGAEGEEADKEKAAKDD